MAEAGTQIHIERFAYRMKQLLMSRGNEKCKLYPGFYEKKKLKRM
jgi:hypothetical protein